MKALTWHGRAGIRCGSVPDPTIRASLDQGRELYQTFRDKEDGCIKLVLKP